MKVQRGKRGKSSREGKREREPNSFNKNAHKFFSWRRADDLDRLSCAKLLVFIAVLASLSYSRFLFFTAAHCYCY